MAIIKCKMCGGDLILTEGQTVAECEYCGSRQTVPKADDEKKLLLFDRAERLRKNCEFDKAAGLYESIVADHRQEAEAYWGLVLCRYGIEYVDDPGTGKKIPTCHRSSFESILEDPDLDQALENADLAARRIYREEAKQIEELRKGIIAVSANEEPYDIFICYKETDDSGDRTLDSVLAQDIYDALTGRGYRVFFSRISLEDKLGIEYEPYIFAALNSAKIMLAVGTDYEYYNAVWVKNEWSRFLKLMAKGKQKHLIPCFKGLDAYDLPKEFAKLQAQDLGKVGAMQDLLRGIEKLLPKETAAPAEQKPEQPSVVYAPNSVEPLLERIGLFLEDRNFDDAAAYCERVLDTDPKNALAYLYKFLISQRHPNLESLVKARISAHSPETVEHILAPDPLDIRKYISQYLIPDYLTDTELRPLYVGKTTYTTCAAGWRKLKVTEEAFWSSQKDLNRAIRFASAPLSGQITATRDRVLQELDQKIAQAEQQDIDNETDAKQRLEEMRQKADKAAQSLHDRRAAQRDAYYENLVKEIGSAHTARLTELIKRFQKLGSYRDSEKMAVRCQERRNELTALLDAQAKARRREEYDAMVSEIETADKARLVTLEQMFLSYKDYLDSPGMAKRCDERRKALIHQDFLKEEAAKKAIKRRKRRRTAITLLIIAAIAILTVLTVKIFLPAYHYKTAEAALEAGDFTEAAMQFGKAIGYQDSRERSMALWDQIAVRDTVSGSYSHTVGLKTDGTVVAVGYNNDGRCDVSGWTDIVAVSTGGSHTVGLKADGTVVAVGDNDDGQCDVEGWTDIVAISAGDYHTVGLKADGTVVAVGYNNHRQCNVGGWKNIVAVSAGWSHTVGLRADGTVIAVGDNDFGECDVGGWTDIVAVSAGWSHTVGLRADGTVIAVGYNDHRQCNVGGWKNIVAVSAGPFHTVGLRADGTVVTVGKNYANWTDIVAVSAGCNHTVGLRADGTIVAVGDNDDGECNVGGWKNIRIPKK